MNELKLHPVEWYNINGVFKDIFITKNTHLINDNEVSFIDDEEVNKPTFKLEDNSWVKVLKENPLAISNGAILSKFTLLSIVKFKGDYKAAESHVAFELMKMELPYARVGVNYFKIIEDKDRWGAKNMQIEPWNKETISDDHGKHIYKHIQKYDKFGIFPSNTNHIRVQGNQYNLYAPFPHQPSKELISLKDIPFSHGVMIHVFGDQIEQGYKYFKLLYEYPKQMLHILTLVSEERETGKTTVLNWIQMIFGGNFVLINPQELTSNFNSVYATKNIIAFEEAAIDKSQSVEKLKSLSTAKSIAVSQKFVQGYQVPFFGKIIMCTNKVRDFMRIDIEENRFWVKKIKPVNIENKNTSIEDDLFKEIPKFLKYLKQLPTPDFSKSRFVLTREEIGTIELEDIKEESKSGLRKELEMQIEDYFNNSDIDEFMADSFDIKEKWFSRDNNVGKSYIRKVLTHEMKYVQSKITKRYVPFNVVGELKDRVSRPYIFKRNTQKHDNFNL